METELKAKEILEYCIDYLNPNKNISKKKEKEMVKEIAFLIDSD